MQTCIKELKLFTQLASPDEKVEDKSEPDKKPLDREVKSGWLLRGTLFTSQKVGSKTNI